MERQTEIEPYTHTHTFAVAAADTIQVVNMRAHYSTFCQIDNTQVLGEWYIRFANDFHAYKFVCISNAMAFI